MSEPLVQSLTSETNNNNNTCYLEVPFRVPKVTAQMRYKNGLPKKIPGVISIGYDPRQLCDPVFIIAEWQGWVSDHGYEVHHTQWRYPTSVLRVASLTFARPPTKSTPHVELTCLRKGTLDITQEFGAAQSVSFPCIMPFVLLTLTKQQRLLSLRSKKTY